MMVLLASVAVALGLVALSVWWLKRITFFWLLDVALDWYLGASSCAICSALERGRTPACDCPIKISGVAPSKNPYVVSGNYTPTPPLEPGTQAYKESHKYGLEILGQLPDTLQNCAFVQLGPSPSRGDSHW